MDDSDAVFGKDNPDGPRIGGVAAYVTRTYRRAGSAHRATRDGASRWCTVRLAARRTVHHRDAPSRVARCADPARRYVRVTYAATPPIRGPSGLSLPKTASESSIDFQIIVVVVLYW